MTQKEFSAIISDVTKQDFPCDFVRLVMGGDSHSYLFPVKELLFNAREIEAGNTNILAFQQEINHVYYHMYVPIDGIKAMEFGLNRVVK